MLLGSRQSIAGKSTILPYDSQVAYLQSSGSQYIDIDYIMKSNTKYEISFSCSSSNSGSKMFFGIYSLKGDDPNNQALKDNFAVNCSGSWAKTNVQLVTYYYPLNPPASNPQYHPVNVTQKYGQANVVKYDGGIVWFNGSQVLNVPAEMPNNPYNIPTYLFAAAVRQKNTKVLPSYYYIGKIMGVKIWDGDNLLVRDLIPVRKDGVGYMYDKVSGGMFGNLGAGSFVVGPDL